MIQLRPHQIAACDAVEASFRAGINRPLLDMCVGSGKSLTMGELARREVERGGRALILAHTRELVEQNASASRALGLQTGINAAALDERCWRAPVISAAIQSVYKSAHAFGPITLVLADECFPIATLIVTPAGDRRIETILPGQIVLHALGEGIVEAVSRREVSELVELEFDNGTVFRCTASHPLFTTQGWTPAELAEGRGAFTVEGVRALRDAVLSDQNEVGRRDQETLVRGCVGEAKVLYDLLLQEARERYVGPRNARKNDSDNSTDRSSTKCSRRERTWANGGAIGPIDGSWPRLGERVSCSHMPAARVGLSDELQDRHCESGAANSDRGGRRVALGTAEGHRRQENPSVADVRVVRVSRIQLASPCVVYNLQVSGHPSYFAHGLLVHNCHLWPHSESGMYRELARALPYARVAGASGTVFRLQGGSLVEGEGAPFEKVVYTYSIVDGIRDGYLVPAFSVTVDDSIDVTKLKMRQGDFTGASQEDQTIAMMDNHIVQMIPYKDERKRWLIFEASVKAVHAMTDRLNQWGVRAVAVTGEMSPAERKRNIELYRRGEAQALVNKDVCTTGFDVQEIDLLCMRFKTKSRGKYQQIVGRLLRTIGGNITASVAAGKCDGVVFDFGGNIDEHGPLDALRTITSRARFSKCEECGARNAAAAAKCYACGATMCKNCPLCLANIPRYELDCPSCGYDMRQDPGTRKPAQLLDTPSGAALIAAWRPRASATEGWLPISKVYGSPGGALVDAGDPVERIELTGLLAERVGDARWIRPDGSALLRPNGASRNSAWQVTPDGKEIIIPFR